MGGVIVASPRLDIYVFRGNLGRYQACPFSTLELRTDWKQNLWESDMDPAQLKKLDVGANMVIRAYEDSLGTGKTDPAVNAGIFTQVIGEAI